MPPMMKTKARNMTTAGALSVLVGMGGRMGSSFFWPVAWAQAMPEAAAMTAMAAKAPRREREVRGRWVMLVRVMGEG